MSARNASRFMLIIASALLAAPSARAQAAPISAPSAPPAASARGHSGTAQIAVRTKAPAFEVVSVKPSQPGCSGISITDPPGRYSARCITLWALMYNAYKVRSFYDFPPGLPAWADKDKFDIEAKADEDTTAALLKLPLHEEGIQGRDMLQSLVADRFQLRVHYEPKVRPIYELVIAKGGFKLKPLPAGQESGNMSSGPGDMIAHGMSIADFAHLVSTLNLAGRTVDDKTGLTGNYEIHLKWTPDDKQATPDAGPTLFTAFEEQLGLKLKSARGTVNTLIVDHLEKPSEN